MAVLAGAHRRGRAGGTVLSMARRRGTGGAGDRRAASAYSRPSAWSLIPNGFDAAVLAASDFAARVDYQHLSRHHRAVIGGEVKRGAGELRRFQGAAQRAAAGQ